MASDAAARWYPIYPPAGDRRGAPAATEPKGDAEREQERRALRRLPSACFRVGVQARRT